MMITGFHGTLLRYLGRPVLLAGLLAAASSGCVLYQDEPTPGPAGCADIAVPALSITVLDASTQAPVPAKVTVTSSGFVEELGPEAASDGTYFAAYERAGVYDILVQSDGYAPETLEGVAVAKDACHVVTEEIVVSLAPDEIACPPVILPGLVIAVVDAATGEALSATVTVTDGAYVEDVPAESSDGKYYAAWERAGVYDIAVSSDGYTAVVLEDVEVTAGACHVETKTIDVSLERA